MIETGRVPKTTPPEQPPSYPPTGLAPITEPIFGPPPIHIPPVITPPEEPPIDMPEPGMVIILFTAALVFWRIARPTPN